MEAFEPRQAAANTAWHGSLRLKNAPSDCLVVSREELCRLSLGRELNVFDRSVDNRVASLRRKLAYGDRGRAKIRSARGRGYLYAP